MRSSSGLEEDESEGLSRGGQESDPPRYCRGSPAELWTALELHSTFLRRELSQDRNK